MADNPATTRPSSQMAEATERLARVEAAIEHHGEALDKMERHYEAMASSQAEMSRVLAQFPNLFDRMIEQQKETNDLSMRMAVAEPAIQRLENKSEQQEEVNKTVNRNAWQVKALVGGLAAVGSAAISALTKVLL